MKKFLIILFVLVGVSSIRAHAQDYNWAIGVRGGVTATGLSVKYNFDPANSIEALVDFVQGVNVYALYERNIPVITSGFHFYYGGGVNLGGWEKHGDTKFTAGINGIVGLEYKIASIPLAFSVDYKPCLNFAGHTGFHAADFGFGIKVAF